MFLLVWLSVRQHRGRVREPEGGARQLGQHQLGMQRAPVGGRQGERQLRNVGAAHEQRTIKITGVQFVANIYIYMCILDYHDLSSFDSMASDCNNAISPAAPFLPLSYMYFVADTTSTTLATVGVASLPQPPPHQPAPLEQPEPVWT